MTTPGVVLPPRRLVVRAIDAAVPADAAMAAIGPDTVVKFLSSSSGTQQMLRQTPVDWLPWNHGFGGNPNVGG